jgi:hypothetical protein
MPQVIGNKQKRKGSIEGLELSRVLAKQVLSQLSYTATAGTTIDFKVFAAFGKLRNTDFALYCVGA